MITPSHAKERASVHYANVNDALRTISRSKERGQVSRINVLYASQKNNIRKKFIPVLSIKIKIHKKKPIIK